MTSEQRRGSYEQDFGDENPASEMIEITVERGGEFVRATVPVGSTIKALMEDGHLRGISVANTRVNGALAEEDTPIHSGDTVSQIPKSGKQG
ncbi:hypothetical protein LCGC14_1930190 [marine sediment metagenome]|uniref:TGS domain-containing protein n=1 Tax=marine sediment metagenome TaxID=412755 RepID=A0A0F9FNS1_9ZZZZ